MSQDHSLKLGQCNGISCKTSMELNNSDDLEESSNVKERLQKTELLEMKLKIQLYFCAFAVVLIIAVYLLIWYFTECWALPFQESPCKQPRDLPLMATNRNTLAEAVDDFVLTLQTQISILHDVVEMPYIAKRLLQFSLTRIRIGQLLSQQSADLFAFGALKREDERLKDVEKAALVQCGTNCTSAEKAVKSSYELLIILFIIPTMVFFITLGIAVNNYKHPGSAKEKMSAEDEENSHNTRLKKLKKRIPLLYIATFICIMAEVALFFVLLAAQYYSGSSPVFAVKCNSTVHNNCRITEAFTDYHSFSTKLNSSLHKSCIGLKNSLSSPILEVRQMAWHYESKGIVTAVEHHLSVKQYYVDRRTMPRKIGNLLPNPGLFLIRLPFLFMVIVLALKPEISIFHDVVEVPFTLLRQSLFAFTKIRIGQLLNQHSADLVAFGALKREDERLEELELAIEEGYIQIFTFQFALVIFLCCVAIPILLLGFLKPTEKTEQKKSSAEERENSQNSRLTKLKRRISFLYIATLLCIVAEFILFSMFVAGIYQGNSPTFQSNKGFKCNETDSFDILRRCQLKVSFSDYRSFSTELESTLDKRIAKLGTSMISPNLEVRQLTYEHQSEAITTAIEHHLSLKQYKVDRRTMPRKIGNVLPGSELIPLVFVNNCFLFSAFFLWVGWGGSVWQVFPCVRYLIRCFS